MLEHFTKCEESYIKKDREMAATHSGSETSSYALRQHLDTSVGIPVLHGIRVNRSMVCIKH